MRDVSALASCPVPPSLRVPLAPRQERAILETHPANGRLFGAVAQQLPRCAPVADGAGEGVRCRGKSGGERGVLDEPMP